MHSICATEYFLLTHLLIYWANHAARTCWLLTATSQTSSNCCSRLNCPGFALDVSVRASVENDVPLNSDSDLDWTAMKPRWCHGTTLKTAPSGIVSRRDPLMSYTCARSTPRAHSQRFISTKWLTPRTIHRYFKAYPFFICFPYFLVAGSVR